MERKNGKVGMVLNQLNQAVILTFCLILAAAVVWEDRTQTSKRSERADPLRGSGYQRVGGHAGDAGLERLFGKWREVAAKKDRNFGEGGVDITVSVPSVTPAATDPPADSPAPAVTPSYLSKGNRFHPLIVRVSREHNVDPALVKAIIMAESGYNPQAVSKVGAGGLMQLMPRTADSLGVQDIFDPEENISGGVKYLKQLLNEFNGEIKLALAAYNAGSSKVRTYNGVPPIGATHVYINKVIEYYKHYRKRLTGPRENA